MRSKCPHAKGTSCLLRSHNPIGWEPVNTYCEVTANDKRFRKVQLRVQVSMAIRPHSNTSDVREYTQQVLKRML